MKIEIRKETENDFFRVETINKLAFWNLHVPGCNEHYLAHILRQSEDYLEEYSRVAVIDGKVVGTIMYSKSKVVTMENKTIETVTFGPLAVDPEYQNKGVGKALVKATLDLLKKSDFPCVIIFGEPDYYPKMGFVTCDKYHITTSEGKNFAPFMCYALDEEKMKNVNGKFFESEVFENLDKEEVEKFDKKFPYMEKKVLPGQWNEK